MQIPCYFCRFLITFGNLACFFCKFLLLLFFIRASQSGYESITHRLLDAGSDGRSHTVTKYSPLYAAVHHGYYNIAKTMLEKFPDLIQVK